VGNVAGLGRACDPTSEQFADQRVGCAVLVDDLRDVMARTALGGSGVVA
jgi:hypothetical protein